MLDVFVESVTFVSPMVPPGFNDHLTLPRLGLLPTRHSSGRLLRMPGCSLLRQIGQISHGDLWQAPIGICRLLCHPSPECIRRRFKEAGLL